MKFLRIKFIPIFTLFASLLLFLTPPAQAGTYGSGNYSGCLYQNNCSASANSGGSSQVIDLENYGTDAIDAYVFNVKIGHAIYFYWQDASGFKTKHSLTLDSIKGDKATITVKSSPQTFTLKPQQQKLLDLNSEHQSDIGIMLNSVTPSTATLRLWRLASQSPFSKNATVSAPTATKNSSSFKILQAFFAAGALLLTLLSFVGAHKE